MPEVRWQGIDICNNSWSSGAGSLRGHKQDEAAYEDEARMLKQISKSERHLQAVSRALQMVLREEVTMNMFSIVLADSPMSSVEIYQ